MIGIIFIPIGAVLKAQSDAAFESIIVYDGPGPASPDQGYVNCSISQQNQGYDAIQASAAMNCYLTFNFTQDIPESTPVKVFYQLTNFFQNHRRYVKSRNDLQVGGGFVPAATLSTSCDPQASYVSNATGLIFAPCGLIATSHFNDAFFVQSPATVSMDETNIAWPTDLSLKFKNPTNTAAAPVAERALNNWSQYQYLWQTYDQMSCYDALTGVLAGCQTWAQVTGDPLAYGKGCAQCNPGDVPRYEGGVPPPGFPLPFDASINALGNATAPFGFRDEHFVVWMRTAGLSKFRKLYGTLVPPPGGFKAGDQVTFEVVPNFEVESFSGTKALVLATMTPTGGKSDVLGIAYLVVGSLCVLIALLFLVKQIVAPRKLGDPSYIGKRAD